ncbi:hypothetical protein AXF42_Ash004496 [Apostasia shenzhenica]|uniref:CCHC-type domain-containing protein n=1 Tax=Apostasia shenzhenica TaxID=1088818 RepID=A0A2I0BGS7_9ASPA|nr:hypothetical protein AXF42_Ash004496 [Apostasia shenzhenica]
MELHETRHGREKEMKKGIALVAEKEVSKKPSSSSSPKLSKKAQVSPSSSDSDEDSDSEAKTVAHMVRRMMMRGKKFSKNDMKKIIGRSSRYRNKKNVKDFEGNNYNKNWRQNIICFDCKKSGHFRDECPNIQKEHESKDKAKKKKKVLAATWDDSDSSSSSDSDATKKHVAHFALMAKTHDESDSKKDLEISDFSFDDMQDFICELMDELKLSKSKVKGLHKELNFLKLEREFLINILSSTTSQVTLDEKSCDFSQVEKLEKKNHDLKSKVESLRRDLELFTKGFKYLNMMLGNQRAVYNKVGIEYDFTHKEKAYTSFIVRSRTNSSIKKSSGSLMSLNLSRGRAHKKGLKAWVLKNLVPNSIGPNYFWVPKSLVFICK